MSEAMKTENLDRLGMYKLKVMLGFNGVFGTFQGFHEDSKLAAGIATVHESNIADAEAWNRFTAEIEPMINQGASRLCQPHAIGHEKEHYWVAYEWMKGNHLGVVVRDNGLPEPADAFQWMSETAEALATLHRRGATHRILSPASIFINELGQAKVLHTSWHHMVLNTKGGLVRPELISILPFSAPEVIGGESVDEAADVYSIGANLYYLLTGYPAHWDDDPAKLAETIRTTPVDLSPLAGKIPNLGIEILEEILSVDPADRPINLPALSDRLGAVIAVLQGAAEDIGAKVASMSATHEAPLPTYTKEPVSEDPFPPLDNAGEESSRLSDVVRQRQAELDEAGDELRGSDVTIYKESVTTSTRRTANRAIILGVVLVVVGIVGITIAVSVLGLFSDDPGETAPKPPPEVVATTAQPEAPRLSDSVLIQYRQTTEQLRVLGQLAKGYYRSNGAWPKRIEELTALGAMEQEFKDAWDTKIELRGAYVTSAGADKKWDNEDDVWWNAELGAPGGYQPTP